MGKAGKALKWIIVVLTVVILSELLFLLGLSLFSSKSGTQKLCDVTTGENIRDSSNPCGFQLGTSNRGIRILSIKDSLGKLTQRGGIYYTKLAMPFLNFSIPIEVQLGETDENKTAISICLKSAEVGVDYKCRLKEPATLQNQVGKNNIIFEFFSNIKYEKTGCTGKTRKFIDVMSNNKAIPKLAFLINARCKPVVTQLLLQ